MMMELLVSSLAFSYIALALIALVLWAFNILRNSRARSFAWSQFKPIMGGGSLASVRGKKNPIERLLEVEGSKLRKSHKAVSSADWQRFEFEIVSAYLLRRNLEISEKTLIRAIRTFKEARDSPVRREIARGSDSLLLRQELMARAADKNYIDRILLDASYKSQFLEIVKIMNQLRNHGEKARVGQSGAAALVAANEIDH